MSALREVSGMVPDERDGRLPEFRFEVPEDDAAEQAELALPDERGEPPSAPGFEAPEADAAEQARAALAKGPDDRLSDDDPLPDEADPADVIDQRTAVPDDGEEDGR